MDITKVSLTTTQAAKVLEMDLPTLRFWDKENALPVPPRSAGQWRKFDFSELVKVALVEQLVRRGLPIAFATDRFEECLHPITIEQALVAENASIAVASFRGGRNLVAVKFICGPMPDSLYMPEYWAECPAHSVELDKSGIQRSSFHGKTSTLPCPRPETVCVINIAAVGERVLDCLQALYVEEELL